MTDNFLSFYDVYEFDRSVDQGIVTFDNPKENPVPEFKYFVRVVGGYRGFVKKSEAKAYLKED